MKVKLFHSTSPTELEQKVQRFLDDIESEEATFQIMDFKLTSNTAGWVASLLYTQVNKEEEHGN